ncbi:thioredoxin [Halobacterium sp. KA-6]|uniref:thioredoxin n=1 Tax=Halobacterium sp. KA-6 TaxID=2896368 RepID=UPI001E402029|nr:thioredoxin [Halobacterium sp. KA-6]MCD2203953.1 thioredoxin [Halobacterium sp. KA-6]
MAENLEEIRQRKLEELRDRAESAQRTEATMQTPMTPIQINGQTALTETVDEHDVVLVDFYADWCGPCQMLEPVVETIAAETDATVAKVDIDANQQLAAEYGVRSVPTLVLFADEQLVERLIGMQDESRLRTVIENHT